MDALNFSCQGESHIASGKVCQDYSYSKVYENGNAIAIVCDGHGGKRYFRSDIGAKIAAEVTVRNVQIFLEEVGPALLKGKPFTQEETLSGQINKQDFDKQSPVERAFRQLFASIISGWNTQVLEHASSNPIKEEEKPELEQRWIEDFQKGASLEKVYGCTLIVYASTPEFWLAFQIGDGKCFSFDTNGQWHEPIPWDERCFLNKTTSICDSSAIDEFRYCYEGDGTFPIAVILGSDGIDDSFGAEENQANFYVQVLKSLVKEGFDGTLKEIETTLPQLSKIGSQDDMSISMVFNISSVEETYPKLVQWQIDNVKSLIAKENDTIAKCQHIQSSMENIERPTRQNMIDLQYANADEKRAIASKEKLESRLAALTSELTGNPIEEEHSTETVVDGDIDNEDASINEQKDENTDVESSTEPSSDISEEGTVDQTDREQTKEQ